MIISSGIWRQNGRAEKNKAGRYGGEQGDLPGATAYYRRALSLPLFPAMADTDVARVVDSLGEALRRG